MRKFEIFFDMLPSAQQPGAASGEDGMAKAATAQSRETKRNPTVRRSNSNLMEVAYERLERLIINGELRPGSFMSMQDLQDLTGSSRTPIYQAVNRLAADTLLIVHPRHGVRISPIDLARDRLLLRLRRDLERFVIELAIDRATSTHRNQAMHIARTMRENRDVMTLDEFNGFDSRIDRLMLLAAGEPFLEHTLRPLHTIFRRIGSVYHQHISSDAGIAGSVDAHLLVLDALVSRSIDKARAANDGLISFVEVMFDELEKGIDPAVLDSSIDIDQI